MTHTDSADVKVVLQVNGSSNVSDMNSSEGGANAGDAGLLLAALGARASQLVTGIAGSTHNTLFFLIPALVTVGILVACVLWYESPQPATYTQTSTPGWTETQPATYTRTSTPGWTETETRPVQSSTSSTLAVTAMTLPSPLCPSMTLSGSESRFVISMKDVHSHGDTVGAKPAAGMGKSSKRLTLIDPIGSGIVDIFGGLAGNVLLKARVHCDNRGQCVEIVTPDHQSRPRVTIGNLETYKNPKICRLKPKNTMDIRGPTSRGMILTEPWGQLDVHPEKSCIVTRSGEQVMKIDGEVDADPDCPRLLVTSADGRRKIASATVILEGRGDDYVDIRVNPGMDPALALALILSVLLFTPS